MTSAFTEGGAFAKEARLTEDQFLGLIAVGRETESVEVKPGGSRADQYLAARVVRAALGMANHEGGGWIVIGIEEQTNGDFELAGVPSTNLTGWNHDDVSAMINGVAEPHIAIETFRPESAGRTFVVIRVQEFIDIPVVCRSNGPTQPGERQIYRKDAVYARSRRKPETIEANSDATTWRTLIEFAGKKAAQLTLRVLGIQVSAAAGPVADHARFAAELEDLR